MSEGLPVSKQYLPLGVGVQSELSEKLVQPGSVTVLENGFQDRAGQVITRDGSETLSDANQATIPAAGTLPAVHRLATLEGALMRFNVAPESMHLWSQQVGAWVRPAPDDGGLVSYRRGPMTASVIPVFAGITAAAQNAAPTTACGNGFAVTAHEYTNSGSNYVKVEFVELETKAVVRDFKITGAHTPRVAVVGSIAAVAYVKNTDVVVDAYNLTTLAQTATQTIHACDTGTMLDIRTGGIGVTPTADDIQLVYTYDSGFGADIYTSRVNTTDLTDNETDVVASGTITALGEIALAWLQDFGSSGKFSLIVADTSNGLYVLWDLGTPAFGTFTAANTYVLDAGATARPLTTTPGIRNVIGTTTSNFSSGLFKVLYEVTAPSVPMHSEIKVATWSGSASTAVLLRSVGIRSKLWKNGTDLHFLSVFPGAEQKTYYVNAVGYDLITNATSSPAALAVAYVRSAGGLTERICHPTDVAIDGNNRLVMAVTYDTRTESIATSGTAIGATSDIRAVGLVVIEHIGAVVDRGSPSLALGTPVEFAGSVFTPGGTLGCFDGHTYGMPAFAYYPGDLTATPVAGGNLTQPATYGYRYCYAYVDHSGRKWRSAPSVVYPLTTDVTNQSFDLNLETLRIYDRGNSTVSGFQIELYRTDANAPGAHFLVASVPNNPAVHTVTVTDNVADDNLGEELYTDGDGLENQLPPSASHVVVFQNRLFMAEAGTGTLWYSLDLDLTHGLLFNEALTKDVGNPDEAITGLAVDGQTLIVFKEKSVWALFGDGANSRGQGQTYVDHLVDPGIGCVNAASILATESGIWFKSTSKRAGFHRVTNGLSVDYVGQGVKEHDGKTVTAAVHVRHLSQYRFYTFEGTTLVWNLATETWGTNTEQPCYHAVSTYAETDGVVYANTDGTVLGERDGVYTEGEFTTYTRKIRSPWLSIAGMKGWERVKKVLGVGSPGEAHSLTVRLYKDFDGDNAVSEYTKQFDGTEAKWQWSVRPKFQKAGSMLVELEIGTYAPIGFDPDDPPVPTKGPIINGIMLLVGIKRGGKKLPSTAKLMPTP
jgi:hypothetical protein